MSAVTLPKQRVVSSIAIQDYYLSHPLITVADLDIQCAYKLYIIYIIYPVMQSLFQRARVNCIFLK